MQIQIMRKLKYHIVEASINNLKILNTTKLFFKRICKIHFRTPTEQYTYYDYFLKFTISFLQDLFIRLLSVRNTLNNNLLNVSNKLSYKTMCTGDLVHLL